MKNLWGNYNYQTLTRVCWIAETISTHSSNNCRGFGASFIPYFFYDMYFNVIVSPLLWIKIFPFTKYDCLSTGVGIFCFHVLSIIWSFFILEAKLNVTQYLLTAPWSFARELAGNLIILWGLIVYFFFHTFELKKKRNFICCSSCCCCNHTTLKSADKLPFASNKSIPFPYTLRNLFHPFMCPPSL